MQKSFDDEQRIGIIFNRTSLPGVPVVARPAFIVSFVFYFIPKMECLLRYFFYFLDPNAKIYPIAPGDHYTYDSYRLSAEFAIAHGITQLFLIYAILLFTVCPEASGPITKITIKCLNRIIHSHRRRKALQYEIFLEEIFEGIITVGHEPYPYKYWCVLSHSFARNPVQIVSKNSNSPLGKDIAYDAQTLSKWFSIEKLIPDIAIPFDEKKHTIRSLTEERNAFLREKIDILLMQLQEKKTSPYPCCENRTAHLLRMFKKAEAEKSDPIKSEDSSVLRI